MSNFIKTRVKIFKIRLIQLYLWISKNKVNKAIRVAENSFRNGVICFGEKSHMIENALIVIDRLEEKSDEIERELIYLKSL